MSKGKNRRISLVLLLVMLLAIWPIGAIAHNKQDSVTELMDSAIQTTSAVGVIRIRTAQELAVMTSGPQSANRHYILENDIHLTHEWAPIEDFRGTFDGRGHTIHNLFVLESSNRSNAGLFGRTQGATVRNIEVRIGSQGVNAFATNVVANAGGLIGFATTTNIFNVHSSGDVSAISQNNPARAGGIIGTFQSSGNTIELSSATGNIYAAASTIGNMDSGGTAGGLVGWVTGASTPLHATISNSFSTGDVAVWSKAGVWEHSGAGGLIGAHTRRHGSGTTHVFPVTITNSYSSSNVYFRSPENRQFSPPVGGLVGGSVDGVPSVISSFRLATQTIAVSSHLQERMILNHSGTPLSSSQMQSQASFVGWDFNNVWEFRSGENNGFPVLGRTVIGEIPTTPPVLPPVNSILAGLFNQNSTTYNHTLATFSAELCNLASSSSDIQNNLIRLGFQADQISQRNYGLRVVDRVAHTIAQKDITLNGNTRRLVVITIRGSEGAFDWASNFNISGEDMHRGFRRAKENVLGHLNEVVDTKDNIILVTGYSRGGGVANLLGAYFNENQSLARVNDVHVYTFASPNSTRETSIGNNIFNLINRADPVPLVPVSLNDNQWNRHGIDIAVNMTTSRDGGVFHHHGMEQYLAWMEANPRLTFADLLNRMYMDGILKPYLITANSPVNISVYNNQESLVGEITNNVATEMGDSEALAFVTNGVKYVFLPHDGTYTVRFTGTGEGTMTYTAETVDVLSNTPHSIRTFVNVPLYAGKEMVSIVGRTIDTPDVRLFMSENGVVVGEITENGTETRFPVPQFTDVASGNWFYPYVRFVYGQGVMQGTTGTRFAPSTNFSRAMVVATLYRMVHGNTAREIPYANNRARFSDVDVNAWYSPYVIWAYDNGIVTGISANRFAPSNNVTREQIATMIHRFAGFVEREDTVYESEQWENFTDIDQISTWAEEGMKWANYHRIVNGRTDTTIVPGGTAMRSEASAILTRFMKFFGS